MSTNLEHDGRVFTILTADELMAHTETPEGKAAHRQNEMAFRRGYCHAFSDVIDLIGKANKSELIAFLDNQLYRWRYSESLESSPIPPGFLVTPKKRGRS